MPASVGIVTISFNQGLYLRQAIESVLNTDVPELEYIIVDAGSQDGSREIIASYGNRIQSIFEPDNGPADGLNKGFRATSADVLGFLNADDILQPNALSFVDNFFRANPSRDVLTGSLSVIDAAGKQWRRKKVPNTFTPMGFLCGSSPTLQQSTFFRRRAWESTGGFNVSNRSCWDGELFVDMALAGCKFDKTNKILASFRMHADSISTRTLKPTDRGFGRYQADFDRIRNKIVTRCGDPTLGSYLKSYGWRFSPRRWLLEYLIR